MIPGWVLLLFEIQLFLALALTLWRMIAGPTAADRMVAVDLLGLLVALLMLGHAIRVEEEAVMDVVLIFSVIAFFGTSTLARYLQRRKEERP